MSVADAFDPKTYWRGRVRADATVGVVGHRSLGTAYNEFIYRRRVDVLNGVLLEQNLVPDRDSILDIGCGSGFYARFWQAKGFETYLGIDVSGAAVARLKAEIPGYSFLEADISERLDSSIARQRYSVITVFDVFYHIVDDSRFRVALRNIRDYLAPNGVLIVFDHLTEKDYALRKHVKFRGETKYRNMLMQAGLEIVERQRLFCFLVAPVFGRKAVDVPVAGLYKAMGIFMTAVPMLGRLLGRSLYEFDQLARKINIQTPNNEVLLIRHCENASHVDASPASVDYV